LGIAPSGRPGAMTTDNPEPVQTDAPTPAPTPAAPHEPPPTHTRTSAAFKGLVAGAVVLLLLLIFILENTQRVKISYFGADGHLSLGVALLLAAVAGALITALVGVARIGQLRAHARRQGRQRSA
jgi:putative membrane protein